MSRRLIIRPWAELDLAEASLWYERQRSGLGDEFLAAVKAGLEEVVRRPTSFPVRYRTNVRRALVNRFPYAIGFIDSANGVVALGVLHAKQDYRRHLRRRR